MGITASDINKVELAQTELWENGPPYELFEELRGKCPVHWSDKIEQYPEEAGFGRSRRRTMCTRSAATGRPTSNSEASPCSPRSSRSRSCAGCSSAWTRQSTTRSWALFQRGFTPKRIADHEEPIRAIVIDALDRLDGRETCDLVADVAQPVVSRVIHSFMGTPPEDDAIWARICNSTMAPDDPDLAPEGVEGILEKDLPELFERCRKMITERREHPTDDLTSVLVHAEVEGEKLRG